MKPLIMLLMLLIILSAAEAYTLKLYNFNETSKLIDFIDTIPEEYTDGLKYIKIFGVDKSESRIGQYWPNTGIDLFENGHNPENVIHELAHHCQHLRGDNLYTGLNHAGLFIECEQEIKDRMINYDLELMECREGK